MSVCRTPDPLSLKKNLVLEMTLIFFDSCRQQTILNCADLGFAITKMWTPSILSVTALGFLLKCEEEKQGGPLNS